MCFLCRKIKNTTLTINNNVFSLWVVSIFNSDFQWDSICITNTLGQWMACSIVYHKNLKSPNKLHRPSQTSELRVNIFPAWISIHTPSKVWYEITYPFLNFSGCTVEVKEWMRYFIPHIMLGLKLTHVNKRDHWCSDLNIPKELGLYHRFRCSGSLPWQVINRHQMLSISYINRYKVLLRFRKVRLQLSQKSQCWKW